MTLLSFMAYADFWQADPVTLQNNVRIALNTVQEELGFTSICWGPVAHKGKELFTDSLAFVLEHPSSNGIPEYTIVIRGTNPVSLNSWLFQDLQVAGMTPWQRQSPCSASGNAWISKATDTSLAIHKSLIDPVFELSILAWLAQTISQSPQQRIKLNLAGHSLGGLMSATFANYLLDELSARSLHDQLDCSVYAIAGPTAGNQAYADQLKLVLRGQYLRIANPLDVATHVWVENDMNTVLAGLYSSKGIHPNDWESAALAKLAAEVRGLGYTQLDHTREIPSDIFRLFGDYLLQAAYQHVFPYLNWAIVPGSIKLLEKIIAIIFNLLKHSSIHAPESGQKLDLAHWEYLISEACAMVRLTHHNQE